MAKLTIIDSKRMSYILAQSAIPMVFPCGNNTGAGAGSCVISATGGLTFNAATFFRIYPKAWFYFPANAINTGQAAGWYYTEMSSTAAGIVYQETLGASPTIDQTKALPSSKTAWSGATGGNLNMPTGTVNVFNLTLPGGSLGNNGSFRLEENWVNTGSTNAKVMSNTLGGTNVLVVTQNGASSTSWRLQSQFRNTGSQSANVSLNWALFGSSNGGSASLTLAIDTSVDKTLQVTYAPGLASTPDFAALELFCLEILPG